MQGIPYTLAGTEFSRLKGFLGRKTIGETEALLFKNTRVLHTFGMQTYLDIIFLDADDRIVKLCENAGPWRVYGSLRAKHALEMASGRAQRLGLVLGGVLALEQENVGG